MALAIAARAARKAAAPVSSAKRAVESGRNGPGARADLHDLTVVIMAHDHPTGVTGQALGRSRGNARALFEDGLAGRLGIGEHGSVDVNHHLVALAGGAGLDAVVKRALGDENQRVGILLLEGRALELWAG